MCPLRHCFGSASNSSLGLAPTFPRAKGLIVLLVQGLAMEAVHAMPCHEGRKLFTEHLPSSLSLSETKLYSVPRRSWEAGWAAHELLVASAYAAVAPRIHPDPGPCSGKNGDQAKHLNQMAPARANRSLYYDPTREFTPGAACSLLKCVAPACLAQLSVSVPFSSGLRAFLKRIRMLSDRALVVCILLK